MNEPHDDDMKEFPDLELPPQTPDAYLVYDGDKKSWLPKSVVEYDSDSKVFKIPEWLAYEKELI